MREKQTEDREFEFMLELMHGEGITGANRIREQLKIYVDESEQLPRIVPESIFWNFESDYSDTYHPFTGLFDEMFPNGYELDQRSEELPLPAGAETYETGKVEVQFTRFTMHIEFTSQYLWDDDADFEEQGWDDNVTFPLWNLLKFDFGDTQVMAAYKTMLDS